MKQVTPWWWPSGDGWPIGILTLSPDELTRRFGIVFERDTDDLDDFEVAAIADESIGQFWLFRHVQSPSKGTEVRADMATTRTSVLKAVWEQLRLDDMSFEWLNPCEGDPRLATPRA